MDFIDELKALSARISRQREHIQTEEATKTAFVLPFISALGYNIFDPTEVTPELTADVGVKKGEKVDYAILQDGKPVMLIECKTWQTNLDAVHPTQLFRYFAVTAARIGILTNGIVYRFFSDLDQPNKLDEKPFLEIDLLDLREPAVQELKRLRKTAFNLDEVMTTASELKYTKEIRRVFTENVTAPTDEFVRFFASRVHGGRITKTVLESFGEYTKRAIGQYISDRISDRLRTALDQESANRKAEATAAPAPIEGEPVEAPPTTEETPQVITTPEEQQAFYVVVAILSESVDPSRIAIRDAKSYCGVLLDDNNRRPVCRFYFNRTQRHLGLFDREKNETRVPIESIRDIYKHAEALRAAVGFYEAPT